MWQEGWSGKGGEVLRNRNAFIYKQRDSRDGIASRAALPAAVVSSQTCAEFFFFSFLFSYFALTADAT